MATPVMVLLFIMGWTETQTQLVSRGPSPLRVLVNVSADTIVFRFLRPAGVRLEGHVIGYGSGTNNLQFISLPPEGSYITELDAEPKYLLSVQSVPETDLHPLCTGTVDLKSSLRLLVRSLSPSAALLSWAPHPHTPLGDILGHCLRDGFYTVRWRERSSRWQYEWCPSSDTVLSDLKPDSVYEVSVRASRHDNTHGEWSKPVYHSTGGNHKPPFKTFRLRNPLGRALNPGGRSLFPPRLALHNRTHPRISPRNQSLRSGPGSGVRPSIALNKRPNLVLTSDLHSDTIENLKDGDQLRLFRIKPKSHKTSTTSTTTNTPTTATSTTVTTTTPAPTTTTTRPFRPTRPSGGSKTQGESLSTTPALRHPSWEESELFQPQPSSDVDAQGKKRYTAPHVVYRTGKRPDEPCSITSSLDYFPPDNSKEHQSEASAPPKSPPSNVTVVTVEGCPSFVILDWDKSNDTTEYEVISTAKGPDGEKVSVLTTNQTHTAVENLRPESSYEFKVKPKNELGSGPESEPVEFSTESADPRVSERAPGKAALWTEFPFAAAPASDCRGRKFVKRTWYRKFVGVQLCNSLRYKIYLSDTLGGQFFHIGDQQGFGEDHCQFVDSFLDGNTGERHQQDTHGFYRALRQEPVHFGSIGGRSNINYVSWYECGTPIPGKW